jgi:myo-inositol-1(or 4)-monophosphatase
MEEIMIYKTSELITKAQTLVKETGQFIKEELGKVSIGEIEIKALNSLVSYVDKEAESKLVTGLSELTPGCGFITEEDTIDDDSKPVVWIIDPLDGTTNFLRQIPHFSVSVALKVNNKVTLGFVYNIMMDEMFSAGLGHGAYLNGKSIRVSKTSDFKEGIIATGFPYEKKETQSFAEVLQKLMVEARGLRRLGSAALDLAFVACGRFDAYYECCINAWDVAAGILIVKEAGGIVTDFSGKENHLNGNQVIASSPKCHPRLLEIIQESEGLNRSKY